jgi:hypothetical protein
MTIARWILFGITSLTCSEAGATSPLSSPTSDVWKRDSDGNVIFASTVDDRLSSLCIEAEGVTTWLPEPLLNDVAHPKLDEIHLVRGMGLMRIDEFVPDWGSWGASVSIASEVEDGNRLVEGPAYFFVIHEGRVLYRVTHRWTPSKEGSRILEEEWLSVPEFAATRSSCNPPR